MFEQQDNQRFAAARQLNVKDQVGQIVAECFADKRLSGRFNCFQIQFRQNIRRQLPADQFTDLSQILEKSSHKSVMRLMRKFVRHQTVPGNAQGEASNITALTISREWQRMA